jgi:SprT protein
MPYIKKLQLFFIIVVFVSLVLLINSWYKSYSFKNNTLSSDILTQISKKEQEILKKIKYYYNINGKVEIIISKKMGTRLYGLTSLDANNMIKIYLNKNMFFESKDYMIDHVIAHEYAHAMMFKFGYIKVANGGHTKEWVKVCKQIGGNKCDRYVNSYDIILNKRDFFKL